MKKLKIWNGRSTRFPTSTVYVCAYSRKDAIWMMREVGLWRTTEGEMARYWNADCWGNAMDGIPKDRGVWVGIDRGTPLRLWVPEKKEGAE